jgi:hypothetical protein
MMTNKFLTYFAVLLLNGCQSNQYLLGTRSNEGELFKNVQQLLNKYSIDSGSMTCHTLAGTRTGICLFKSSAEVVEYLRDRLKLTLLPPYQVNFWKQEGGCSSRQPFQSVTDVYGISGRPSVLKLGNATNFEYLLLYYHPDTSQICLQVSYAYG